MRKTILIVLAVVAAFAGRAQYQLSNGGFENWSGSGNSFRPDGFTSFPQADGTWAWAASTPQHYRRAGHRPGGSGGYYLTIYSRSVMGVVANGNMTTGQIHAGSTSATSTSNYNYTHRGTYAHPFTGTPDSMYVWVSFRAASASSQGVVRAYIHGNSDFQDPNHVGTASLYCGWAKAEFTRTTSSATTPSWVQQRVPFHYDGTSAANYILLTMATNVTGGAGSAGDSLLVDDIEFVYSAWLDGIAVNGTALAGFSRGVLNYSDSVADIAALQALALSATPQASDATVTVTDYWLDGLTRCFYLHVAAENGTTTRVYTVTFHAPMPPCGAVDSVSAEVEETSAVLRWTPGVNNLRWEVEYGPEGFASGEERDTVLATAALAIAGLDYDSRYQARVRAFCNDTTYTDWSAPCLFATGSAPVLTCPPVEAIGVDSLGFRYCCLTLVSPVFDSAAADTLDFDSVATRLVLLCGADTIADTLLSQPSICFDSLRQNTTYVVKACHLCDSTHQSSWCFATFATPHDSIGILSPALCGGLTVCPNPASDWVTVASPEGGLLRLVDFGGREVLRRQIEAAVPLRLSVASLPAGHYMLVLRTAAGTAARRIVVSQ